MHWEKGFRQTTFESSSYYLKEFTDHHISLLEQEKEFEEESQEDEQKKDKAQRRPVIAQKTRL